MADIEKINQDFINQISELLKLAARDHILPHYKKLKDGEVEFKEGPDDPVSIADREAENFLKNELLKISPHSLFVGEESFAADRSSLIALDQADRLIWCLDPIDGTLNFVGGQKGVQGGFGPMLALVKNSKVLAGWVYNVVDDRLMSYSDATGLQENGRKFEVISAPVRKLYKGNMGFKISKIPQVQAILASIDDLEFGSTPDPSIVFYDQLLKGEFDFLVFYLTFPWDHIMFYPMLRSLGFIVKNWYDEDPKFSDLNKGLLIAKNEDIYRRVKHEFVDRIINLSELKDLGKKYET